MFHDSPNANPHLTNNSTTPGGQLTTDLENMVNLSATSKSTPSTLKSTYTELSDLNVIDPEPGFELNTKDEELDEGLFTVMPSSDQITQKSLTETMSSSPDPPLSHPWLKPSSTKPKGKSVIAADFMQLAEKEHSLLEQDSWFQHKESMVALESRRLKEEHKLLKLKFCVQSANQAQGFTDPFAAGPSAAPHRVWPPFAFDPPVSTSPLSQLHLPDYNPDLLPK